jgi:NAD(P)-dependent dehydrogenase (short-subunit alcohol dehydrogenase family)
VGAFDLNPTRLDDLVATITTRGGQAFAQTVDVSNKMAVQTALYDLLEQHAHIDLLVNAAHVTPHSVALKLDEWEWNRALDVNLKGAFLVAQTVARAMKETGGGVIVNVVRPPEHSAHAAVRAAREGLLGLTAALAAEWQPFGIRVLALPATADPTPDLAQLEISGLQSI